MTFPSEQDFALFLFQLFLILSAALVLGGLFRRLGQPPVVGEILAWVLREGMYPLFSKSGGFHKNKPETEPHTKRGL